MVAINIPVFNLVTRTNGDIVQGSRRLPYENMNSNRNVLKVPFYHRKCIRKSCIKIHITDVKYILNLFQLFVVS